MAPIDHSVDLDTIVFSKLTSTSDVSSFKCSDYYDLEDFLKTAAHEYLQEKVAVTYLVYSASTLLGFFSLAMGCISTELVTDDLNKKIYYPRKLPALLVARMAVTDEYKGLGIGKEMLARVIAMAFYLCPRVGCRVIKVDAKNNPRTINFYQKHGGFVQVSHGEETVPMIIDMNKIHCHDIEKKLSDYDEAGVV
jgi:GNAT superfamily N-acetyltransferase